MDSYITRNMGLVLPHAMAMQTLTTKMEKRKTLGERL